MILLKEKKMRTLIYILIGFISIMFLSSCSYHEYAKTKQEFAKTESVRMQNQGPVIIQAFTLILEKMAPSGNDDYLINHTYYDSKGRQQTLRVKDSARSSNMLLLAGQIMPILEKIYVQQQLNMDAPPTAEGIAIAFVKQLPALGAIWGFTDLGKAGIKGAGDSYENVGNDVDTNTNTDSLNTTNTDSLNNYDSLNTTP